MPEWTVRVTWQCGPPIWEQFGLDPDPDRKWQSTTVANTNPGSFGLLIWEVEASDAFRILAVVMSMVLSASAIGISSMPCLRTSVSSLGIAGRFTTPAIWSSATEAGIEYRETHSAEGAASECSMARASAVTYWLRTHFRGLSHLNLEKSLWSSSSFVTASAVNSFGSTRSNISTCEYSAKAPLSIIMRLMLSQARMKAFWPMFPLSSWSWHNRSKYDLVWV